MNKTVRGLLQTLHAQIEEAQVYADDHEVLEALTIDIAQNFHKLCDQVNKTRASTGTDIFDQMNVSAFRIQVMHPGTRPLVTRPR